MISDARSAGHVCAWISACVVLHNFLIVEQFANDVGLKEFDKVAREDDPSEQAERTANLASVQGQMRTHLFSRFVLKHSYLHLEICHIYHTSQ